MKIRKTTEARIALLEAFVVFYAFAAGTTESPAALAEPGLGIRLAIPTLLSAAVLLFRNVRSASAARSQYSPLVDVAYAFAAAIVSQAILSVLEPEFLLPPYRFTRGAVIAWCFLGAMRAWFPHRFKASRRAQAQIPITIERLRWDAIQLEIRIRQWSHWANLSAAAAIGLLVLGLPFAGARQVQVASAVFIAGAAYVAWIVHRRGSPEPAPLGGEWKHYSQYCRNELQRQAVLLDRLWHWYFGSLIPGVLLLLQGSTVYGCFILTYILLIGELLYRAIEWIQLEMARIQLPESRTPKDSDTLEIAPQS
jgi:hypothetical protein